jgi:methylmalonyl-CoA mutase
MVSVVSGNPATRGKKAAPLRFLTATSLYDGHDAAIGIVRRLLVGQGAEVVHLGHNRSVDEVVHAALQEDVDAVAVSSYQGGHIEYFKHLIDRLVEEEAGHIQVYAGGGGTISREEAAELEAYGVAKVYLPEDGRRLGWDDMVRELSERTQRAPSRGPARDGPRGIGQTLSLIELGVAFVPEVRKAQRAARKPRRACPVLGVTGPGGAGKSSVIDELLARLLKAFPDRRIALIAIDPTRQKGGGALLADRMRINCASDPRVYMRSMATRRRHLATAEALPKCLLFLKSLGFGLIIVETAGTGQGDAEISESADLSLYVMSGDYGAPSQLEKIAMLDHADLIALNKSDKAGALDALREVRGQWRCNHLSFAVPDCQVPVYPTVARLPYDPGVERLFLSLCERLSQLHGVDPLEWQITAEIETVFAEPAPPLPPARSRYLAEIAAQGRAERAAIARQVQAARRAHAYYQGLVALGDPGLPEPLQPYRAALGQARDPAIRILRTLYQQALSELSEEAIGLLQGWPSARARMQASRTSYAVRGKPVSRDTQIETPSRLRVPRVALPPFEEWGEQLRFLMLENLPGAYPFTAGVYPYRRSTEEPTRMFAGEGTPERTNHRFHYLCRGQRAARLSTAFDPLVLYGEDPDLRPDAYGRLGMSGVSVATLDDVKRLYSGFALAAPSTSVSMTINGPAPVLLAMYMNTAIDQEIERHLRATGGWTEAARRIERLGRDRYRPRYRGPLPPGHDGLGLGLLGVSGADMVEPETYGRIRAATVERVRGTVQADVLKEDQAQNECLYAVEFALRMMGDIEEYFIAQRVRNYYSVSVSGYHIAEAGANPITQLAFTLANAFTLVECYLARGLRVDDFAPHLSFFFSNAMDPEYAVLGRVARRIWARAMRHVYKAGERSQKLKYHVQTSGRSLQAQAPGFNDIRTTLEALYASYDNCNSLHTNAYDEALCTPSAESVRRAIAIQLIINRELGLNAFENPLQGSFVIGELGDRVEEAVYEELDRLSERGGVLGAMEWRYQRNKIQEEGLDYERRKQDGTLPIVGVNTFASDEEGPRAAIPMTRASEAERQAQVRALREFHHNHRAEAPAALARLKDGVRRGGNSFTALMEAVCCCSLGQITEALYEVGGRYRRSM